MEDYEPTTLRVELSTRLCDQTPPGRALGSPDLFSPPPHSFVCKTKNKDRAPETPSQQMSAVGDGAPS